MTVLAELKLELWTGNAAQIRAKRVRKKKTDREDAKVSTGRQWLRGFDSSHPFNRAAVGVLLEVSAGRPGQMPKLTHDLIEEGGRNAWLRIGEPVARWPEKQQP